MDPLTIGAVAVSLFSSWSSRRRAKRQRAEAQRQAEAARLEADRLFSDQQATVQQRQTPLLFAEQDKPAPSGFAMRLFDPPPPTVGA